MQHIHHKEFKFYTTSVAQTNEFGHKLGALLHGGEIIELRSDLGGGKTTLTQSIVAGSGSTDPVASPTFTVSNIYHAPRFEIHHYDFYRLHSSLHTSNQNDEAGDLGVMKDELQEVLADKQIVSIIEWAGSATALFPVERHIVITIEPTKDEHTRHFSVELKNTIYPEITSFLETLS